MMQQLRLETAAILRIPEKRGPEMSKKGAACTSKLDANVAESLPSLPEILSVAQKRQD